MIKTEKNGLFLTLAAFMLALISAVLLFTVAPKRPAKADEEISNIICVFEISAPNTETGLNSVFYSSIDWGDGTVNDMASHTYVSAGTYTVIISGFQNSIPSDAFSFNTEIKSAVLPSSITHICTGAFDECSNFTSIVIYAITPPILDSFALPRNIEEILVPASSVDAYKAAEGFSSFADIISAIPEEEPETPDEPTEPNETTEPENSETNNEGKKPFDFGEWIYNAGENVSTWISDNVGVATTGSTVLIVGAIIIIVLIFRRRR